MGIRLDRHEEARREERREHARPYVLPSEYQYSRSTRQDFFCVTPKPWGTLGFTGES